MHSLVSSSGKIPIAWKSCLWSRSLLSSRAITRFNTNGVTPAIGTLKRRGSSAIHTFQPSDKLKGKVALVAGGDSGIGRSVCYHFAKEGATIAFTYVKGDEDIDAKETLDIINESKMEGTGDPIAIPTDLRYDKNCKNVVDEVIEKFGQMDVLVNLPAVQYYTYSYTLEEITEERLEKANTMVKASHAMYTDRFHELVRLVPNLVTPESRMIERYVYGLTLHIRGMVAAMEPKTIQKAMQISCALIDETRNAFAANQDCRSVPRNVNPVNAKNPTVRSCYECGCTDHVRPACPRLNRAQGPKGNCPNQVAANNEGLGRRNQENQARGKAFMLGAEEARRNRNIVTGIEPSELGFKYKIEIASGHLVEIDKKERFLLSAKTGDKKQEEIIVVRDFPKQVQTWK
nr:glucose and ribitol dehydrogenase-like [Tanacetum cinerariifolium]